MCGILGGTERNWNYEDGIKSILHRGPDGNQIKKYSCVCMAFCRLAIQDLSQAAMQPMSSADDKVHIVFNGEIYGYQELKKQLSQEYAFRTTSDTEVILNAYLKYGQDFVKRIDGIFAIVIYDERIQKLMIYRDRIGVKPFYYYYDGKDFAFASELKALEKTINDRKLNVDFTALYDYLFYQYIPEPKSLYKNVYKLRPATMIIFDLSTRKIENVKRYWRLHVNTAAGRKRKREDVTEELRFLLSKTIKEQMISDVPLGIFLSGGIDSSIVSYEAGQLNPDIQAFSIGFEETERDESFLARKFCEMNHIDLFCKTMKSSDFRELKGCMASWYDEPFGDDSAFPTYLVSRLAREKCTVVLTGDGGDEVFGGYARYKSIQLLGEKIPGEEVWKKYGSSGETTELLRKRWRIPKSYDPYWHYRKYYVEDLPTYTRMRYLDLKTYLPEAVLTKVDRASMAVSLEARVPFLAQRIVEFGFSLSQEEYLSDGELKGCLKDAYKEVIPQEIMFGIKKGFGLPSNYLWKEKKEDNLYIGLLKTQWNSLFMMKNRTICSNKRG